jgi:hypothetical protein
MKLRFVAAWLLLVLPVAADSSVEVVELDGGRQITVAVEGKLLAVAEGPLLLVAPPGKADAGPELFSLDLDSPDELRWLAGSLPRDVDTVAVFDLDGDGRRDIVLGEPGRLYRVGTLDKGVEVTAPELVLEADLDLAMLIAGDFLRPHGLVVPQVGILTSFGPDDSGQLVVTDEQELPVRAARESTGLVVSTPTVTFVRRPEEELLVAVGPEALGPHRLRSLLLGDGDPIEAWSWLPEAEQVVDSWYVIANGRPALIVATISAQSVGLFEKKKLRVFPLKSGDRSRTGGTASFKAETISHHWQRVDPTLVDVTGDGLDDLVVVQPEGLSGKKLLVEAYPGRVNARFHPIPLRSVVPARQAVWHFGVDVTGDGVPDLVARSETTLQVFAGLADAKKKRVVSKKPHWQVELSAPASTQSADEDSELRARGRPEVRDVDGDGRPEILVRGWRKGWSVLWVVDSGGAGPP